MALGVRMNKILTWILSAIMATGVAIYVFYTKATQAPEAQDAAVATETTAPVTDATAIPATPAQVSVAPSGQEPAAAEVNAPAAAAAPEIDTETDTAIETEIDTVRIDADGYVLVAGRGAQGATITAVVDGADVATTDVQADGNFVLMFDLPPSDAARVLALRVGDGTHAYFAGQDVIVAPSVEAAPAQEDTLASASVITEPAAETTSASSEPVEQDSAAIEPQAVVSQSDDQDPQPSVTETPILTPNEPSVSVAVSDLDVAQEPTVRLSSNSNTSEQPIETDRGDAADPATVQSDPVASTVVTAAPAPAIAEPQPETIADLETLTPAPQDVATVATGDVVAQAPADAAVETSETPVIETTQTAATDQDTVIPKPAATVFVADPTGVKILQSDQSVSPDQVVLDAISYDDAGNVVLSGRGTAGATLNLYLDNVLTQSAQVDAGGFWRVNGTGIAAGVYTLRIDQIGQDGKIKSRFETPFKREDRATLAQAVVADAAADSMGGAAEQGAETDLGTAASLISAITVQPGNTLWGISRERYGEGVLYVRVFDANRDKIRDPDLIYPGQVFVLPDAE